MMAKHEKLEVQIVSLTSNNKDKIKHISSLENDLMAIKKTTIEEMLVKLEKQGTSLEERSPQRRLVTLCRFITSMKRLSV